ncbi:MAG: GxxExxY protein [Gemmatimonadota bacterium]|nr:GxxExxY protein [Gemmatimonadota bacterium]
MDADTTQPNALLHRQTTERIIGVFYDVYNELGRGYLESVYVGALAVALQQKGIPYRRETPLDVIFRGVSVGFFRADLVVEERVVVEVKAARTIDPAHEAQLLNYLRASRIQVGLLLNFGHRPGFRRLAFSRS